MVVSSACMIVAVMAQIVTMVRRMFAVAGLDTFTATLTLLPFLGQARACTEQRSERAPAFRIDVNSHAHSGAQQRDVLPRIEDDAEPAHAARP